MTDLERIERNKIKKMRKRMWGKSSRDIEKRIKKNRTESWREKTNKLN